MNEQTIVIKIGSRLLTDAHTYQLNQQVIEELVSEVATLAREGKKVAIVSSGAVASGRTVATLRGNFQVLDKQKDQILREQILAAVGQPILIGVYQEMFEKHGLHCAQVLLTRTDFADRKRYLSLRAVMNNLLRLGIIPIVNENDVLSTEELQDIDFTDNDQLSCMVAAMVNADRLLILTNVPGLMDKAPDDPTAQVISEVSHVGSIEKLVKKDSISKTGKGGMQSKIRAADLTTSLGIPMQIIDGYAPNGITRAILKNEKIGTSFPAHGKKLSPRKAWISTAATSCGSIVVSTYLADLLRQRRFASILLRGVESVGKNNVFKKGDVVDVLDDEHSGYVLGRGEIRYSADELRDLIKQRDKESAQEKTNGEKIVIHYDYFVFD